MVRARRSNDPRSASYLQDAHALGIQAIQTLECQDLYFIEGQVDPAGLEHLATQVLSDPITQTVEWGRIVSAAGMPAAGNEFILDVALRPGVLRLIEAAFTDGLRLAIATTTSPVNISALLRAAARNGELAPDLDIDYTGEALLAPLQIDIFRFQRAGRGYSLPRIAAGLRGLVGLLATQPT